MKPALPSDRSFGWTFTAVFLIAAWFEPWCLALVALMTAMTLLSPQRLAPFKRVWMKFGDLLHRVVSPVVLGIIYFVVFTPVGVVMRLSGRDAMNRRFDSGLQSYWLPRTPPGPPENSFRDMF
jgi:hypothetical protein